MSRNSIYSLVVLCALSRRHEPGTDEKNGQHRGRPAPLQFSSGRAASVLLVADDASFDAFAKQVGADVDSVLSDYTISDKETLRELLGARSEVQLLAGDTKGELVDTGSDSRSPG